MVFLLSIMVFTGILVVLSALLIVAERLLVAYGICRISVNAGEKILDVDGGQTLLSALYDSEVFIPSACGGKGTCGHCKITVETGGGPVLPTETPFLSRLELRTGVRLACQLKVKEDLEVLIPEEFLAVRLYTAEVASARSLTHDIREIELSLVDPIEIDHHAGQYIQVRAPSPEGYVFRAYSISSPEYVKNRVQLIVKLVPGGIASTYLRDLRQGDQVVFTGPYGEFRLSEREDVEIVCVAGGCGLAPMKSIVHTLLARWPQRSCWLFFGCRTLQDVFYLDEMNRLAQDHPNFHVVCALSHQPGAGDAWPGETGLIHLSVEKHLPAHRKRQAFLCGPLPMIEAVTAVLKGKGLRSSDIYYDEF